jgi:hypothetical protein
MSEKTLKSLGWKVLLWIALLAIGGGAMFVVFWYPPTKHAFYPACGFYQLTGFFCPGCGGIRAWHELLHGRWLRAMNMNVLAVTLFPGLAIWWGLGRLLSKADQDQGPPMNPRVAILLTFIVLAFSVLRNLPWGPSGWLAP